MNLLWRKNGDVNDSMGICKIFCCRFSPFQSDSDNSSDLYVDIFKNIKTDYPHLYEQRNKLFSTPVTLEYKQATLKSDETATKSRNEGDVCFEHGNYIQAMVCYNLSLRFAATGSQTVALAYINRASCFLHLKMYDKCLIDIDLATHTPYSEHLMQDCEKLRTDCLELMKAGDQVVDFMPELSYDADENFPGMANVMEIKYNDKFGRHIVAKSDIDVGKIVLLEEAFISEESSIEDAADQLLYTHCANCQKSNMNFIACEKCPYAAFCSIECMDKNKFHKTVCEYKELNKNDGIENDLQALFFALDTFPNVDDLMGFVEDAAKKESYEIPKSLNDAKSRYRAFLQLNKLSLSETDEKEKLINVAYVVYTNLLQRDLVKTKFDTEKKQSFLMHLVLHHRCVILSSSLMHLDKAFQPVATIFAYLNHSCAPNLLYINSPNYGNRLMCITVRPIKKGQQLFVNYMDLKIRCSEDYTKNTYRRRFLLNTFGFKCTCECCKSDTWLCNGHDLILDSRYKTCKKEFYKYTNQREQREDFSYRKNAVILQRKLIELLKEYGNGEWGIEMVLLTNNLYISLL